MDRDRMYIRAAVGPRRPAAALKTYDLVLLAGVALLFPILMLLPNSTGTALLRVPIGLALVLLAPGYAFMEVLFPHRADLDEVARIAISFGLSAVTLPVLALVLNALPWGLQPWPMTLALSVWIALLCAVAVGRRWALARSVAIAASPATEPHSRPRGLGGWARARYVVGALATLSVLIAVTSILIATGAQAQPTEFYVLGTHGQAQDYPRRAAPGDQLTATIGIVNRERNEHVYRVEVWASDPHRPDRRALIEQAGPIVLAAEQRLEQPIVWRMPWTGDGQTVEFLLFMGDNPTPYRQLSLSLDVAGTPAAH
jgi:uncharacterized membrane protein